MSYATSKYLIYNCFTNQSQHGNIGGSLLIGHADTVEEANIKIDMYKARRTHNKKQNSSEDTSSNRYTCVENRAEWWFRSS